MSVCLSVRPSVCLSVCLSVRLSLPPSVRPSVCPSAFPFIHPSILPSFQPSIIMIIFCGLSPFKPVPLKLEDILGLSIFVLVFPAYNFYSCDAGILIVGYDILPFLQRITDIIFGNGLCLQLCGFPVIFHACLLICSRNRSHFISLHSIKRNAPAI